MLSVLLLGKMNLKKYLKVALNNPSAIPWQIFYFLRRKFPLDYYFFNGWSFPPDIVTILVTKKCNYNCFGCCSDSPQYTTKFKGKELNKEQIIKFIDSISWFKPGIYFCGGEPTLREDLFELIRYAKKKKLVTAFTTNGSLISGKNLDEILFSGLDFISFSLDGPAKHHDSHRGTPGAYDVLIKNLDALIKRREQLKMSTPNIRITSIINPENKDDALFVLGKAEELGVDEIAFSNFMFYPQSSELKQKEIFFRFNVGGLHLNGLRVKEKTFPFSLDLGGLNGLYQEIKARARIPVTFVPKEMDYEKFFSFRKLSQKSRCLTPWFVASLLPDGNFTTCQEFSFGRIREDSFSSSWNSPKMRKFRIYRKKRPFPACFRCTEGQEIKFD